jgi:hypothetical protein
MVANVYVYMTIVLNNSTFSDIVMVFGRLQSNNKLHSSDQYRTKWTSSPKNDGLLVQTVS